MTSVLVLGFLLGMRHALDADHLAAVAALAGGNGGAPRILRLGAFWALGHSVTLVIFGAVILLTNSVIPPAIEASLECLVGFLLIILGIGVLRRVVAGRVHIHAHRHGNHLHLHAHAHSPSDQAKSSHHHSHAAALSRRAILVGVAHGLAGSAALLLLTLATIESVWIGIGYLALFGIGTIIGMGLLSWIVALPLQLLARRLALQYNCLLLLVGAWSVFLGGSVLYENSSAVILGL